MNWKEYKINFGTMVEGSRKLFNFESLVPLDIQSVKPGCGSCTKLSKYNKETKILKAVFTAETIPIHLRSNPGYQVVTKAITVTHESGEVDTLIFTGKIIKKNG